MRILIISLSLLALASCTFGGSKTPVATTNTGTTDTSGSTVQKAAPTEVAKDTYVTLNYTLHDGSPDGKILETTVYSTAQANGMSGSESNFQPFSTMIGTKQVIPGFENGLIGMKKGEKKVIEVLPEVGYWTGPVISMVPKYQIAPVFTITQDKKIFSDVVTETVSRDKLPENMKDATVGQVFTGANNATAKVTAVTNSGITLAIENTTNPFYKKSVVVGAVSDVPEQGVSYKITAINGTGVTIEVTNKNSPFYNKKFAVGESIELPSGKLEIRDIQQDEVEVAQYHPMMGKTLYFDVEVLDIK